MKEKQNEGLKFPETLRSHWLANIVIQNILMIKEEGSQHLQRSVRMPSQRQMISKYIRSSILIMRMEISVRYPIRQPKMEFRHCLIFMMRTDGCRRSKENCIPRGRQQRKSSEVIPMMTGEDQTYVYDAENRLSQVSVTKDGKTAVIQQNIYL